MQIGIFSPVLTSNQLFPEMKWEEGYAGRKSLFGKPSEQGRQSL
jgi:hypothetical protein